MPTWLSLRFLHFLMLAACFLVVYVRFIALLLFMLNKYFKTVAFIRHGNGALRLETKSKAAVGNHRRRSLRMVSTIGIWRTPKMYLQGSWGDTLLLSQNREFHVLINDVAVWSISLPTFCTCFCHLRMRAKEKVRGTIRVDGRGILFLRFLGFYRAVFRTHCSFAICITISCCCCCC